MERKLTCCVGVIAFNEEKNIRFILEALAKQRLQNCEISEIVVVSSGCKDETENIVASLARSNPMIRLIAQQEREGKASAINLFLAEAKGDVVVVESGDTIPDERAIENLVRPFVDPQVGMTGAHPIPINSKETFMGYMVNLFWRLHHEMALEHPKLGELVAFRNIIREIPKNTAVDEASIEAIITEAGYRIHYAKEAIVHNKGPETVRDFLKQRRRIMVGHKHLQVTHGYTVSTMKFRNLVRLFWRLVKGTNWNFRKALWTSAAIFLEGYGRFLGDYDYYIKKKNPYAWDIAQSTKTLKE
jgi:cellulose synthase/poly-beta-1,6-N-acetylglucosamine synthase-like glycosyltransferase